jgi:GntR family transcriptional regulator
MIEFRLDRRSGLPPYLQLVAQVQEALRMGWLRRGDQLPTVREVVASATVNANTVMKAYKELALSGLIETRPGAGTYICGSLGSADPQTMAKLRARLVRWVQACTEAGLEPADVQALMRSALPAGDAEGQGVA